MKMFIKYSLVAVAILLIAGCGGETEFPSLDEADNDAAIYFIRNAGDGFGIWRAAGGEISDTGFETEAGSWIAIGDGELFYSRENAIYGGKPEGREGLIIEFPGGECREIAEDRDTVSEYVACWEVRNRFRDLTLSPDGSELAFVLEQVITPLKDAKIEEYRADEISDFRSRAERYFDSGVYVVSVASGGKTYLGPGKQVFAFPEDGLVIIENDMAPVRVSSGGGDYIPLITSDRYEYGWVPQVDYNGEAGVLVAQESDEKADEVINYVYSLDNYALSGKYRIKYIDGIDRATSIAVSPDGEFVVITIRTDRLGTRELMVGSLQDGYLVSLVSGGTFLEFLPSGNGFYYYMEGGRPGRGDIFGCGLDGEVVPVTDTGDIVPPGFLR